MINLFDCSSHILLCYSHKKFQNYIRIWLPSFIVNFFEAFCITNVDYKLHSGNVTHTHKIHHNNNVNENTQASTSKS